MNYIQINSLSLRIRKILYNVRHDLRIHNGYQIMPPQLSDLHCSVMLEYTAQVF